MIDVERFHDPAAFERDAAAHLLAEEARHNLLLGVVASAAQDPSVYPTFHGWIARAGGAIVGVAAVTPPFSVIVATPRDREAIEALAATWRDDGLDPSGVTGAVPEVEWAADAWIARAGGHAHVRVRSGVFELTAVADVPRPAGRARAATRNDRDLLVAWHEAFAEDIGEAGSPAMRDPARIAAMVDGRIEADDAGFWIWDVDGDPVSLAAYSGPTGTGIRIGPVYTPSGLRGRGYATGLVADLSAWLLASGRRACFLYTDLANPTSNAIYERIGYRRVCDALDVTFRRG